MLSVKTIRRTFGRPDLNDPNLSSARLGKQIDKDRDRLARICESKQGRDRIVDLLKSNFFTTQAITESANQYSKVKETYEKGLNEGLYQDERSFLMLLGKNPFARRWGSTLTEVGRELGAPYAGNWFTHDRLGVTDPAQHPTGVEILEKFQDARDREHDRSDSMSSQSEWKVKHLIWGPRDDSEQRLKPSRKEMSEGVKICRDVIDRNLTKFFPRGGNEASYAQACYLHRLVDNGHLDSIQAERAEVFERCSESVNAEIWERYKGKEAIMPTVWLADADFSLYEGRNEFYLDLYANEQREIIAAELIHYEHQREGFDDEVGADHLEGLRPRQSEVGDLEPE